MVPPERIRHLRGHHPLNDRADEEINKLHHSTVNDHAQFIYSTFHSRDSICAIDDCFKDFHDEGGIHWNGVRGVYRCHLTSLSSLRGFALPKELNRRLIPEGVIKLAKPASSRTLEHPQSSYSTLVASRPQGGDLGSLVSSTVAARGAPRHDQRVWGL